MMRAGEAFCSLAGLLASLVERREQMGGHVCSREEWMDEWVEDLSFFSLSHQQATMLEEKTAVLLLQ
jgi:hypothetical protein